MNTENNAPIGMNDNGGKPKWLTRKEYTDPAEKKKDFWIGVGIFFALNIALTLCQWVVGYSVMSVSMNAPDVDFGSSPMFTILYWGFMLLPWVINIGLIVYFAFTRSQIALGMVAGFGIALAIVICLGVIFTVFCFSLLLLSSGGY